MRHISKQNGYSLLVTLILVLLFSILGLSLLSITTSGISKNNIRQNINQSADLSDKGIDYITQKINTELTTYLGKTGQPRNEFIIKLKDVLEGYKCQKNTTILENTVTGNAQVCIESIGAVYDTDGKENPLRKLVEFNSIGHAGNAKRKLTSSIEIGAAYVPDILRYAIGTNNNNNNIEEPGEGNLLLHGGVSITGDIKVDGNLLTYNRGYISGTWENSFLPEVLPYDNTRLPYIYIGNKSYKFNSNNINTVSTYNAHKDNTKFNTINGKVSYSEENNLTKLFREVNKECCIPEKISRKAIQNSIAIDQYQNVYKYLKNTPPADSSDTVVSSVKLDINRTIDNKKQTYENKKVFPYYGYTKNVCIGSGNKRECKDVDFSEEDGTFNLKGENIFNKFSTLGNLEIKPNSNTLISKGMYIEGDLFIGEDSNNANSSTYSDITLEGVIFVNGNVKIRGVNLSSDVIIYSNKDVDIQFSTIQGKKLNPNKTGSLIVFAKGDVVIKNISSGLEQPSRIKGFFYSEKELELYGVQSNMKIEGGISGRSVVLNAVRSYGSGWNYSRVSTNNNSYSRLQVIYDSDIIDTYLKLQREPIVTEIDTPIERNRIIN